MNNNKIDSNTLLRYQYLLKGNYQKGVNNFRNILCARIPAMEFAKSSGVLVVFGMAVENGQYVHDRNSSELLELLRSSKYYDDALSTYLALCTDVSLLDFDSVFSNADAMEIIKGNQNALLAIYSNSAAIGKYVAALAGLPHNEYSDMAAVAASEVAMTAVLASEVAMAAVLASEVAMAAVAASEVAMAAVAASEVAMTAVLASEVAMTAVANNEVAATTITTSAMAMSEVLKSNNDITLFDFDSFRTYVRNNQSVFENTDYFTISSNITGTGVGCSAATNTAPANLLPKAPTGSIYIISNIHAFDRAPDDEGGSNSISFYDYAINADSLIGNFNISASESSTNNKPLNIVSVSPKFIRESYSGRYPNEVEMIPTYKQYTAK